MSVFKKEFEDEVLRLYSYDKDIKELLDTDNPELGIGLLYSISRINERNVNAIEDFYKVKKIVRGRINNKIHEEKNHIQVPDVRIMSTLQIRLERVYQMYVSGECYKDKAYARSKIKCPLIFELNNGFVFSNPSFCSFYNCPEKLSSIDECPGALSGDCWKKYDNYQHKIVNRARDYNDTICGDEEQP